MAQWSCWINGKWSPYSGFDCDLMEEAYTNYLNAGQKIFSSSRFQFARGAMYEIDFEQMSQTNTGTGKSRNIQRSAPVVEARRSRTPSPPAARTPSPPAATNDDTDATEASRMHPPIMPEPQRELSGALGSHGGDPAAAFSEHEHDNAALPPPDEEDPAYAGASGAGRHTYAGPSCSGPMPFAAGGFCCILVLLTVILVPLSFNYIPPNTVGIKITRPRGE